MVTEYRKASAEAQGWIISSEYYVDSKGKVVIKVDYWKPHENPGQREMIENLLIEQGCAVQYMASKEGGRLWKIGNNASIPIRKMKAFRGFDDKSKSIAFMKAFMEYIKH